MSMSNADVVVVGGGIVGVCTALQLQRTGRKVIVIERGVPGDEASGHNGGMFSGDCMPVGTPGVLRSLPKLLRDPESPLIIRKRYLPRLAPWLIRFALSSLPARVEAISIALNELMSRGVDAYRPLVAGTAAAEILENRGFLYGYRDPRLLQSSSYSFDLRKRRGVAFEFIDKARIASLDPAYAGRFEVGAYFPNAYFTKDPREFTQILLDDVVARGGSLRRAEVTGFATTKGRVDRVLTSDGDVAAGSVVIAAGPWSRALLRSLGTNVALDVERGYGADLPDPGIRLEVPVVIEDFHVSMTPHRGGIRVTGIDELASISAPEDLRIPERLLRAARRVFPELRTDGAKLWMRRRPSTPDSLPIIGRAPRSENTYLAFGHAHKGLCQGAITGKLVQELMDGLPTTIDIRSYSPSRFTLWPRSATSAVGTAAAS
jgi:glycine/D-amino acid oxidase-like deaminating enzyme